jgi:hypothetical protein
MSTSKSRVPNFEELDRVMDFIDLNPRKHDQNTWGTKTECGTTACLAGWTVLINGGHLECMHDFYNAKGENVHAKIEAMKILNLDKYAAGVLFYAGSREEIHYHIDRLKRQYGYPTPEIKPEPKIEIPTVDIDAMYEEVTEVEVRV